MTAPALAVDTARRVSDTDRVLEPGERRHRLARTLNAAFAEGLLSQRTLTHRLDLLFASPLIDPLSLVGDLTRRIPRRHLARRLLASLGLRRSWRRVAAGAREAEILLGLDWSGAQDELVIGRDPQCDLVLSADTVSRRHARLIFRDGTWIIQDLDSTNGTRLNGQYVGRCRVRPGDWLALGNQRLRVD